MTDNPNKMRIRGEGGHAWTLRGKCRFCGMTRVLFKSETGPIANGTSSPASAKQRSQQKRVAKCGPQNSATAVLVVRFVIGCGPQALVARFNQFERI